MVHKHRLAHKRHGAAVFLFAALALSASQSFASATVEHKVVVDGKAVFDKNCAMCHDNADPKGMVPLRETLGKMNAGAIYDALTNGKMRAQGAALTAEEKNAVVSYLAGDTNLGVAWIDQNMCPVDKRGIDINGPRTLTNWGVDPLNTRRMSEEQAGIDKKGLERLEVAWKLVMPGATTLRSQGAIVGSTLFYAAGQLNFILALDTQSGCVKWASRQTSGIRSSVSFGQLGENGRHALVATDNGGQVVALDALTGERIWRVDPRHDQTLLLTGTPLIQGENVIVPVSATDVITATVPNHECCKGRGAVVKLDAKTGKIVWTWHTMPAAVQTGKNSAGVATYGPSGAPIWSSPSVDTRRGLIFTATGENTSPPATETSNAIAAINANDGTTKWVFQGLKNDIWNMSCPVGREKLGSVKLAPNCEFADKIETVLLDQDFGAGPLIFRSDDGRDLILGGQKSGSAWALDIETGKQVWHQRFGFGSPLGGVHWGIATDGKRVFVPISDPNVAPEKTAAGLYAVDVKTGEVAWSWRAKPDCENGRKSVIRSCNLYYGLSAAPVVVGKTVLAGALDGRLYVFDTEMGKPLAIYDTVGPHEGTNGIKGNGGAIDNAGVFVGDGLVFVNSGYGQFLQQAGNTLIAYRAAK